MVSPSAATFSAIGSPPNLAATNFDELATSTIIDFEAAPLGFFTSLSSSELGVSGVNITPAGSSDGDDTQIRQSAFNVTPGGSKVLEIFPQQNLSSGVTFNFAFL